MNNKIVSKVTSGILLGTMLVYTTPVLAFTKNETVYSKLDSSGNSYNTVVSAHIENEQDEKIIKDLSDLLNIENTNGDEEFKQEGNNLTWYAEGNDIYYQGETKKELPIECKVKYELDGEEKTAEEIAGKSGKIKVSIEYVNKEKHGDLYTPFIVICGTIIKNENNQNIKITNGKAIDNGNKTVVIGFCMPGLQESLGLSKDRIDIPSNIEITMDTTKFELSNMITYVTPKITEGEDFDFSKLDEIYEKINLLRSSSKQMEEGANELKSGAETYSEKTQEFETAMKQVSSGISNANANYSKLNDGINSLNQNTDSLKNGAKSVSEGLDTVVTNLNAVSENIEKLQAGTKILQEGINNTSAGVSQVSGSLSSYEGTDNSEKIQGLEQLIEANQGTIDKLSAANTLLNSQLSAVDEGDVTTQKTITTQIETNESIMILLETNNKTLQSTVDTLKATDLTSIAKLKAGISQIEAGMSALQDGAENIYNGQGQLKDGVNLLVATTEEQLGVGAKSLYQGTVELSEGTQTLSAGSSEMKAGLNTLDNGTGKLTEASSQLAEGANTIKEGINTLTEGIGKFNTEGIEPIYNYINGDLKDISTRAQKLQDLSNEYNNFTMLNDGDSGKVKFIMIIDSIKEEESSKEKAIIESTEVKEKEDE